MSVFDTLAEIRYATWLEKSSQSDSKSSGAASQAANQATPSRKTYEGYLFSEVVRQLKLAAVAHTAEKRSEHDRQSRQLEFQLMLLLEKRTMPLAAASLRSSIASLRRQYDL